ncbi:uncharacterized protein EV420DRAFT_1477274 [Desarmillaria tabescens]|uniref:Uncharacterized protein n=1 Tax=Armillaria tabescens TaxID=1929756 RepID=A0AA39NBG3_ARMTA|nr:uncharacterized protein EV420DRAFT_1477274 [Desarmillaria tabescens]KAK0462571.1 hypothetical protein EV420DRAFT_1477274 [Desarmillaria tabescens]
MSIPNTLLIDESIKKAKAKGAAPKLRLPVTISLLNKNALKMGYSPTHYLYNSEKDKFCKLAVEGQGILAKVFVQNVQHGVSFPPLTPHTEVMQYSGWIPILEEDLLEPTELFYKSITKGLSKKSTPVGGLKYSQRAPENWYIVLNPAAAERYDKWKAGDTLKLSPVKNGKGKKHEESELDSSTTSVNLSQSLHGSFNI